MKQPFTVDVAGLIRAPTHTGSLTNKFQRSFPVSHSLLMSKYQTSRAIEKSKQMLFKPFPQGFSFHSYRILLDR